MEYFVNKFIDNSIQNYLLLRGKEEYDKAHLFEIFVIRALVKIYGEINIMNPYKIKSENSFKCNLLMYGLTEKEMNEFFDNCELYEKWLDSNDATKTDLTIKIEKILIDMLIIKARKYSFSDEELAFFNKFFDPVNNTLAKMHSLITTDNDIIPNYWRKKKLGLDSKIDLVDVRTDLLASDDYESYGIEIKNVEKLDHKQVMNINSKIEATEKKQRKKHFIPKNIIISTGSGFVDTLMILSIMSTEIMIGLLFAFRFLRG